MPHLKHFRAPATGQFEGRQSEVARSSNLSREARVLAQVSVFINVGTNLDFFFLNSGWAKVQRSLLSRSPAQSTSLNRLPVTLT